MSLISFRIFTMALARAPDQNFEGIFSDENSWVFLLMSYDNLIYRWLWILPASGRIWPNYGTLCHVYMPCLGPTGSVLFDLDPSTSITPLVSQVWIKEVCRTTQTETAPNKKKIDYWATRYSASWTLQPATWTTKWFTTEPCYISHGSVPKDIFSMNGVMLRTSCILQHVTPCGLWGWLVRAPLGHHVCIGGMQQLKGNINGWSIRIIVIIGTKRYARNDCIYAWTCNNAGPKR